MNLETSTVILLSILLISLSINIYQAIKKLKKEKLKDTIREMERNEYKRY